MRDPVTRFLRRLMYWVRFRSEQAQLREELTTHREMVAENFRRDGLGLQDAQSAAHRSMGNETFMREESRGIWLAPRFDALLRDWRFGWRGLRRSPVFTVVATLSLAIGIGANTAIFSVLYSVLLEKLPVPAAGELVHLTRKLVNGNFDDRFSRDEIRALNAGGVPLSMFTSNFALVQDTGIDDLAMVDAVDAEYFTIVGVRAQLGRLLSAADSTTQVAVISDRFWRNNYNADPMVLGRTLRIEHQAFTIVGVAPTSFTGVRFPIRAELFVPYRAATAVNVLRALDPRERFATVFGRRASPSTLMTAEGALAARWRQCCSAGQLAQPTVGRAPGTSQLLLVDMSRGIPFAKMDVRASYRLTLIALMAGVGVLLITACVNVANLLLARSTARARELALRLALGASRLQLVMQLLVESMQLSMLGAAVGLLFAQWCTAWLVRAQLGAVSDLVTTGLNPTMLLFTAAVSVVTGVVFGVAPAVRVMRTDLITTLRQGGRQLQGAQPTALDRGLVAVQMALALLLVSAALLLVQTVRNLEHAPLGFKPSHLLAVTVETRRTPYEQQGMNALMASTLLRAVRDIPGVQSAGFGSMVPVYGGRSITSSVSVNGSISALSDDDRQTAFVAVTPDYFSAAGITLRRGRDVSAWISPPARAIEREVVVNELFARKFIGTGESIGHTFEDGVQGDSTRRLNRIVGVVSNTRFMNPRTEAEPMYFVPVADSGWRYLVLTVRSARDPLSISPDITRALTRELPGADVGSVAQLQTIVASSLARERTAAQLGSIFGVVALALAAIGLYGVMLYQVAARTPEIGIRMALGARRSSVVWLVMRHALTVVGVGVVVGVPLALMAGHGVASQLYDVPPNSIRGLLLAATVLLVVTVGAVIIPVRRALAVDPLTALRQL